MNFFSKQGQMLVETMVALSMVVIGMLGLLALLSQSIGINKVVADQYIASYLAAEGIEIVKYIIDNNTMDGGPFNNGLTGCGGGCSVQYDDPIHVGSKHTQSLMFNAQTKSYTYDVSTNDGTPTSFKRVITINSNPSNTDELIVTSVVEWQTRGGSGSKIEIEDHFFNWRG